MQKLKVFMMFLLLLGLTGGISQISNGFGDAVNIQTQLIEGFQEKGAWEVKFSKFRCRNWNNVDKEKADETQTWINWIDASSDISLLPDGLPKEARGKTIKMVMGVKACFDVKGYNWLVVEPKKPLQTVGITRAIDLWVWGSGYNYDLYIVVKNWQGFYYSLYMGNLKYFGWRNLRAEIPAGISQWTTYIPRVKPLEIVRLKLISAPDEKPDDFYAYFNYMQVQTDIYEERFNGDGFNNQKW